MSSKNDDRTSAISRPQWSLAARLSLWYAGSAFLLLLIATGFLYWALIDNLRREDDTYLAEKANVLRALLRDHSDHPAMIEWEIEAESTARPLATVFSRVVASNGRVVFETKGMSRFVEPPRAFAGPLESLTGVRSSDGRLFRVLTARTAAGPSGTEALTIQVALDQTYEEKVAAEYRERLWLVLGLGLIVCALAGYAIARRGVRPIEGISTNVRRINSTTLDQRIRAAGLPAELWSMVGAFNEMLERLEDGFARLARFSSDIAHELRTPINNLRGEMEVTLARARSPEEYRDVIGSALEECVQLSRLIDNLLFIARAENPQTEIRRERVDLGRELRNLREFYEAAASEASVSLELDAPADLYIELDRTLLQRSVGNLIENALAHTPAGGTIRLAASEESGHVAVSVSDTGCGIPASELPYIFDRFRRVDHARSKNTGGLGLGLAIVKSIAALHGGSVQAQSEPGRGTCITLSFS